MAVVILLAFLGIAVYLSSHTALSLLSLSEEWASAQTEGEMNQHLGSGEALLALNRFSVPGAHPGRANLWQDLISIELPGLPAFVSILLILLAVIFVLTLHELIHASVFYLDQRVPPQIGIRGPVIFAAAPGFLSGRRVMVLNALAPFTVISLLGLLLITVLPPIALAWVFIPTVINAAASGGDFLLIHWMGKQPAEARYEDTGDALTAYKPL